jgi:hypothetical protein
MVEAAGIEPASEDIQQKLSTCISSSLISFSGARRGKAPKNQPQEHFTHPVQGAPGSLSCSSTLPKDRRSELEKRHAYCLGSEWLCYCTYLSPPFCEVDGISTCSFCLTISVESVRPHIQLFIIFRPFRIVNPLCRFDDGANASLTEWNSPSRMNRHRLARAGRETGTEALQQQRGSWAACERAEMKL